MDINYESVTLIWSDRVAADIGPTLFFAILNRLSEPYKMNHSDAETFPTPSPQIHIYVHNRRASNQTAAHQTNTSVW